MDIDLTSKLLLILRKQVVLAELGDVAGTVISSADL
jgi:hypothetical protein